MARHTLEASNAPVYMLLVDLQEDEFQIVAQYRPRNSHNGRRKGWSNVAIGDRGDWNSQKAGRSRWPTAGVGSNVTRLRTSKNGRKEYCRDPHSERQYRYRYSLV